MTVAAVELEDVTKAYAGVQVLRSTSLALAPGQRTALTGRSGSGKTTVLRIVAGLELPDTGLVHVAGSAMHCADDDARASIRARVIGFVFQHFNLIPTLNVRENLEFQAALAGRPVDGDAIDSLLKDLDLGMFASRFPANLSGGEQQRVAVARAIVHQPALILADEPTANLDRRNAENVMALLAAAAERSRAALLLVTHQSDLVIGVDRKLRISDGDLEDL